jgi:hypothetical protein
MPFFTFYPVPSKHDADAGASGELALDSPLAFFRLPATRENVAVR